MEYAVIGIIAAALIAIGVMFFVRLSGNADIGLVNPKGFSRSTRSYVCTYASILLYPYCGISGCWHFI